MKLCGSMSIQRKSARKLRRAGSGHSRSNRNFGREPRAFGRSNRDRASFRKRKSKRHPDYRKRKRPTPKTLGQAAQRSTPNVHRTHESRITNHDIPFSTGWHCAHCDIDIRPPTPGLFSFNNPLGACPECRGFGRTIAIDLNKAIPDRSLTIKQGVVRVFRGARIWRIAKRFAPSLCPRRDRHACSIRRIAESRSGFRDQRREARRLHRRRLRGGSLVRRPRFFPLAREQDLQNARARAAQPLSRVHDLSKLQGRTISARNAEL